VERQGNGIAQGGETAMTGILRRWAIDPETGDLVPAGAVSPEPVRFGPTDLRHVAFWNTYYHLTTKP